MRRYERSSTCNVLIPLVVFGWILSFSYCGAQERSRENLPDKESNSEPLVIYLGTGGVNGPGKVVQMDRSGKITGTVNLLQTPNGLATYGESLVAVLRGGGFGKVIKIDGAGEVEILFDDKEMSPGAITIAADEKSGDILFGDNMKDKVFLIPAGKAKEIRTVLQFKGVAKSLEGMSLAAVSDGQIVFGVTGSYVKSGSKVRMSSPNGIYRFPSKKNPALGKPLISNYGSVAAHPSSKWWVAAFRKELKVFEGDKEVATLPYPADQPEKQPEIAFGADGKLVIVLESNVLEVDLDEKVFRPLFTAKTGSRIESVAVGPKLRWKE